MQQNMEIKPEIKPIKRYECKNCGALLDMSIDTEVGKTKCCKNPNLQLVLFENSDFLRSEISKCFELVQKVIKVYMDMPAEKVKIVSLWILGTYFHNAFDSYPYLFINAMRGSGKTRLLKIISNLSYMGKGKVYSGARETLLFRTPKHHTLVFDEMESIGSNDKASFREYLNASYKKGATVSRAKKVKSKEEETFVLEDFEPYKPIAMANIWGMDDVLGDRCLTLILEKSDQPTKTKLIEDFDTNPVILYIKRTLSQFSDVSAMTLCQKQYRNGWNFFISPEYANLLETSYMSETSLTSLTSQQQNIDFMALEAKKKLEEIEKEEFFLSVRDCEIDGRNLELFFPLFSLIMWLDKEQLNEVIAIGKDIIATKREEEYNESVDVLLYQFVGEFSNPYDYIPTKDLTRRFREFYGADEFEHKWINEKWMGKALRRLNLVLDKKKMSKGAQVRLNSAKAKEKLKIFKGDIKKKIEEEHREILQKKEENA